MNYFVKLGHVYTAQNNLQKHLAEQVRRYDNMLVESPDLLMQHVKRMVDMANIAFPRCRVMSANLSDPHRAGGNHTVSIGELATYTVYPVAGEIEELSALTKPVRSRSLPADNAQQLSLL